ncbi:MAG: hypothetical protein OXC12_15310, partial [Spirochaetaceae bacterium]|nr:hypothetical protein [Spirochaetaceae bacterium]
MKRMSAGQCTPASACGAARSNPATARPSETKWRGGAPPGGPPPPAAGAAPPEPHGWYGYPKRCAEERGLLHVRRHGMDVRAVRMAAVTGPFRQAAG